MVTQLSEDKRCIALVYETNIIRDARSTKHKILFRLSFKLLVYPKHNLCACIINPCRKYMYIGQAQRIEPSPVFIIVTGVIINLRVYKHSLWAHVVFVVTQHNGTVSSPSPQNTHSNTLSYCLVVLHHTFKLTHASRFAFISLFYIIHFSALNHNST
jgi:hypothetical protein